jgi:hypothetical protein
MGRSAFSDRAANFTRNIILSQLAIERKHDSFIETGSDLLELIQCKRETAQEHLL